MNIRKPLIITGAAAVISAAGVSIALAATNTDTASTLADKIAEHFHLNKAEVQQVIDQNKQELQASREQKYESRLNQAVTDGKITATQKDLIIAKHKEVTAFRQSLKGKTPADRRSAMKQERTDLQAWEKANNIPSGYLMGGRFGRHS